MHEWIFAGGMAVLVLGGLTSFWTVIPKPRVGRDVWVLVVIGLLTVAGVIVGFRRDTYLPFLGNAVFPCSLLELRIPENADTEVTIHNLEAGAKVVYWCSSDSSDSSNSSDSSDSSDSSNVGVARVSADGSATLRFQKLQSQSYIQWRVCLLDTLSPVQFTKIA